MRTCYLIETRFAPFVEVEKVDAEELYVEDSIYSNPTTCCVFPARYRSLNTMGALPLYGRSSIGLEKRIPVKKVESPFFYREEVLEKMNVSTLFGIGMIKREPSNLFLFFLQKEEDQYFEVILPVAWAFSSRFNKKLFVYQTDSVYDLSMSDCTELKEINIEISKEISKIYDLRLIDVDTVQLQFRRKGCFDTQTFTYSF